MRASAVLLHLNYGAALLVFLEERGEHLRLRPWFEAVRAAESGDRRLLQNIAVEIRPAAEALYDDIERRLAALPAVTSRRLRDYGARVAAGSGTSEFRVDNLTPALPESVGPGASFSRSTPGVSHQTPSLFRQPVLLETALRFVGQGPLNQASFQEPGHLLVQLTGDGSVTEAGGETCFAGLLMREQEKNPRRQR
jgi:hypothetical protein